MEGTSNKFRENAQIVHNAAAKRKIAANLVKKESSTQLRIFNTLFTAQGTSNDEEGNDEILQKKREKEKKLESVIQARIEQREAEEKEREAAAAGGDAEAEAEIAKNLKKEKDLFANLSPISSTEDECEKESNLPKIRKIILHRVQGEIKEMPPWILADPLRIGRNQPEVADAFLQTEYISAPTATIASNTDEKEIMDSETQYETEILSIGIEKPAFQTIMEELSEEIFLEQLLAIRSDDFSRKQTILLRPESIKNAKIDSFLLLLQNEKEIGIEKWSLKNLIKPDFIKLFESNDLPKVTILDANDEIAITLIDHRLICISPRKWQITFITDISQFSPISLSITKNAFILASSKAFQVYSLKSFKLIRTFLKSKFTDNLRHIFCLESMCFVITKSFFSMYNWESGIHINSKKFPFSENSKENFVCNSKPHFCAMKNGNILIFNPFTNSAIIINPQNFANLGLFEHEFLFDHENFALNFAVFSNEIFSVDSKGNLSKWELLKNGRKVRSKMLKSSIENSLKALAIAENIFAILTPQNLFIKILPDN